MINIRSISRAAMLAAALMLGLGSVPAQSDIGPSQQAETLRLHLGTDGTYFEFSNSGAPITQTIGAPKNCLIKVAGPLASLSGSDQGPGLKDASIGIRSGGPQGVPCSRVDSTEDLSLSLDGVPDAVNVALDLELKGNVKTNIVLSRGGSTVGTFQVRAGGGIVPGQGVDGSTTFPYSASVTAAAPIANCRNASDSGPDSGGNDNCRLTIDPGTAFDAVTFQPVSGEISLEGGGDFGLGTANDTLFTLVSYDGELGCDTENNSVTIEEGTVYGQITRLQNTDGSDCVLKPYNLGIDTEAGTLSFVPHDNEGAPQLAAYQATLKFEPQDSDNPFTSTLQYDQDDDGPLDWQNMPWCAGDPYAVPDAPGSIDIAVIPAGHTWCVVAESTGIVSETQTRTTWTVVGVGDPRFQ